MLVEGSLGFLAALGFGIAEAACPTVAKAQDEVTQYLAAELDPSGEADTEPGFRVSGSLDPDKARNIDAFRAAQVWKLSSGVRIYCTYGAPTAPTAVTLTRTLQNRQLGEAVVQRVEKSKNWTASVGMFGDPVWECRTFKPRAEFGPACGR